MDSATARKKLMSKFNSTDAIIRGAISRCEKGRLYSVGKRKPDRIAGLPFRSCVTNGNAGHRGATSNDDGDRAPNGANSRSGI